MKNEIPLHVVFCEAWIRKEDKFLVAKRSLDDDQAAGAWAVPGGKVDMEVEQDIVERTLKREVKEEVGLEVKNPVYFSSDSFIRSSGHNVVVLSYLLDYVSGKAKPLEDQEEVKWVQLNELAKLLEPHFIFRINKLKKLF